MAKSVPPPPPPPIAPVDVNLREALEERYLAYALSTIMGRALPDARDGLKPVHRRILYGMHILRLDPGSAFKKCAKIVGDVMGSFHPHGDQAIYEALVRLAQDFASRYPLIEGQGNFGNIDGDNAAAYRYTEARMTDVARLLMEGVEEDSVDWRDNYSGDTQEPIVMPSAVPNLLANGAQGIAVGMATSIPRSISSPIRAPTPKRWPSSCLVRTSRPAASSSTPRPQSSTPTAPAAAPSVCARGGPRRIPAAAAGSRSSPRSPTASRNRG